MTKKYEMICKKLVTALPLKMFMKREVFPQFILRTSVLSVFTWNLYFLCHFSRLINKHSISACSKE